MARKQGSHAEITGPRIEAAARRLFARSGYAAVSMREIAAEVGVSAGALYAYTADKQTLLYDQMRGHMEHLLAAWEAARRPDAPPAEQLRRFTEFHISYHLERPKDVFIAYMELRNLTPPHFTEITRLRRRYEDALEAILRDGQVVGVIRVADTRLTTRALIAMLTGVNTWYREGGELGQGEIAAHYWQMVARMVGLDAPLHRAAE